MIQLRWSDETEWKDFEPAEKDVDLQINRLKAEWAACKKRYRLHYDAEFRVKP
jgi:hypothetical protein